MMAASGGLWLALVLIALLSAGAPAPATELSNASFDTGQAEPQGWVLSGGTGAWEPAGRAGGRAISVTGAGQEADSNSWRSEGFTPRPGALYRLSFWVRGQGTGGSAIAGLDVANRDFPLSPDWTRQSFVFRAPEKRPGAILRFGQWMVKGKVTFDDVSLVPALPVHRRAGALELGIGERVRDGRYVFEAPLSGESGNYARPLLRHTAGFNSTRWVFGPGHEVVYRHTVGRAAQQSAEVTVNVGYHTAGACRVEASADGRSWRPLGRLAGLGTNTLPVPADLLPAASVWVRLRAEGDPEGAQGPANLQVYGYRYSAQLAGKVPDLAGDTHFLEVSRETPGLAVTVTDLGPLRPGDGSAVRLRAAGLTGSPILRLFVTEPGAARATVTSAPLKPGSASAEVRVPYRLRRAGAGRLRLALVEGRRTLWEAATEYRVSPLHAADYGYPLASSGGVDLWWCESTYKVSRDRPAPSAGGKTGGRASARSPAVLFEAARGEYEPAQVILRPRKDLKAVTAAVTDLVSARGRVPASEVEVCRVGYVPVTVPTDAYGEAGDWPDPLPPVRGAFSVQADTNQPLWIIVHVPEGTPAGEYRGALKLASGSWKQSVPLKLTVWDFTLPRSPHIVSAFGFSPSLLQEYHHLDTEEEIARVHDLYLRSFARHRISPYNPMALAPIKVEVVGDDVKMDFTEFDRAAKRYLDEFGFTTFSLPVQGLGGGTFYSRVRGSFGGHEQGTPEYERLMGKYLGQLQDHLEARGWLSKAFVYWFDEPEEKDYDFVAEGMAALRRHAPKLARMLTKHPSPRLQDSVEIWCPILNDYDPAACQAQQRLGKRVWWYVCTGPKSPYTTLFIDHPAVNLRQWVWLSAKYGVDGLLVWESHYWTSGTAFPPPALQNPYADPMSYVSGYGVPAGTRSYWGNGDGRFLYPPEGYTDGRKRIEGPVSSFRWEMLREGLEDADTFYLLREAVRKASSRGAPDALLAEARRLQEVPPQVARGLTDFSHDPQPMLRHRRAVARMIERLNRAAR